VFSDLVELPSLHDKRRPLFSSVALRRSKGDGVWVTRATDNFRIHVLLDKKGGPVYTAIGMTIVV